jgi:hypothetical protein
MTTTAPRTPVPSRWSEQGRRNARAQQRAFAELRDRYPDEYRDLYLRIKAEIYAECGDLPAESMSA